MKVAQLCPTFCDPMNYTAHGILQARVLEWVPFPFSRGSPNPGITPRSLALQADSLPAEPQGKPKNTAVGSLSLLQKIFPTQEPNRGLLHCRKILYQLSHMGSPPTPTLPYCPSMPGSSYLSTPMKTQCPSSNPALFLKCPYSYSLPIGYARSSGPGP